MEQTIPSPESLVSAWPATPRALLESRCELVQATIRSVARAARLSASDSEDFHSYAWVQLLEGNCRRIARFRGDCPFSAFLRIVLNRVLLDYRVAAWGRWRPSQEARQDGPQAIELERLVLRDGYPLAALENQGIASAEQIERVRWKAAKMVRRRQRETSMEVMPEVACADPQSGGTTPPSNVAAPLKDAGQGLVCSPKGIARLRSATIDPEVLRWAAGQPNRCAGRPRAEGALPALREDPSGLAVCRQPRREAARGVARPVSVRFELSCTDGSGVVF